MRRPAAAQGRRRQRIVLKSQNASFGQHDTKLEAASTPANEAGRTGDLAHRSAERPHRPPCKSLIWLVSWSAVELPYTCRMRLPATSRPLLRAAAHAVLAALLMAVVPGDACFRCSLMSTAAHSGCCGHHGPCHKSPKAPIPSTCVARAADLAAVEQPNSAPIADSAVQAAAVSELTVLALAAPEVAAHGTTPSPPLYLENSSFRI